MIIISPAKRLTERVSENSLKPTTPYFKKEAAQLAKELALMTSQELGSMMHVSEGIAELNASRFKNWNQDTGTEKRAIFQFEGDVFKHLNVQLFNDEQINYMNKNLKILSGIYGLLRPSDAMNPYRLEMGTKYNFNGSKNLYEFWGDKIAKKINEEISLETKNKEIHFIHLDLTSLKSVKEFVNSFTKKFTKLDGLVNNAAVMHVPKQETVDGFEFHFGVNFLGHVLLTELLLPYLKKSKSSRIIHTSSVMHDRVSIDLKK